MIAARLCRKTRNKGGDMRDLHATRRGFLAGTAALWAHYGTAVFFEMVVAGIAACL